MRIEAGRFRGRILPRAHGARPVPGRLRRSLFGVLAEHLEGARVLDLFAGVGGLGLEALSRGAAHVTLVDQDARAVRSLKRWIDAAGVGDEATVLRRDLSRGGWPTGPFDLEFLDPPFAFWDGPEGPSLVGRAMVSLASDGRLALKLPSHVSVPEDERWCVLRHRVVGSVAWALLAHTPSTSF